MVFKTIKSAFIKYMCVYLGSLILRFLNKLEEVEKYWNSSKGTPPHPTLPGTPQH